MRAARTLTLATFATLALGGAAFAQSTEPLDRPADELKSSGATGAGSGEGTLDYPAGIPADPNTNENQQPGPFPANPTDPAAGSDPAARIPTDPEKQ